MQYICRQVWNYLGYLLDIIRASMIDEGIECATFIIETIAILIQVYLFESLYTVIFFEINAESTPDEDVSKVSGDSDADNDKSASNNNSQSVWRIL